MQHSKNFSDSFQQPIKYVKEQTVNYFLGWQELVRKLFSIQTSLGLAIMGIHKCSHGKFFLIFDFLGNIISRGDYVNTLEFLINVLDGIRVLEGQKAEI